MPVPTAFRIKFNRICCVNGIYSISEEIRHTLLMRHFDTPNVYCDELIHIGKEERPSVRETGGRDTTRKALL